MPNIRRTTAALTVLAVTALAVTSLAGCRGAPPPTPPGPQPPPAGTSVQRVEVDGTTREYRVHRPPGLALDTPVPLVLMLHGAFGSAEQAERGYGWNAAADRGGFVVAYPDGQNRAWSVGGGCCGEPGRTGVDDVAFQLAVVADLSARLPVDASRVFATGMSNGAMMSYRLACETDVFAAVAPVAGTLLGECPGPRAVSLLHIHGLADGSVPFDGSPGTGRATIDGPPVEATVGRWRTVDGCPAPTVEADGPVTVVAADCPAGRAVTLITIDGAGHSWPGAPERTLFQRALGMDPPSTALDATEAIWRFFQAHPRP